MSRRFITDCWALRISAKLYYQDWQEIIHLVQAHIFSGKIEIFIGVFHKFYLVHSWILCPISYPPETHMYVYLSGGIKCYIFGKTLACITWKIPDNSNNNAINGIPSSFKTRHFIFTSDIWNVQLKTSISKIHLYGTDII